MRIAVLTTPLHLTVYLLGLLIRLVCQSLQPAAACPGADSSLIVGNGRMELRFDGRTGEWVSWTTKSLAGNLLAPAQAYPAVDVSVGGSYLIATHGATLLRHRVEESSDHQSRLLAVTVGILPQATGYAYELTSYYQLRLPKNQLVRWAKLLRNKRGAPEHFDGFRFQVPGVAVGNPVNNTLTIPGPFFPRTFLAPHTPYDSVTTRQIGFHSAPDAGFGLLMLTNPIQPTTLGSYMSTRGEVAYLSSVQGNGQRLTLRHDDKRAYYLRPAMTVNSDPHWLELAQSPEEVMHGYQQVLTQTMPLDKATPDWVKQQVILEVYPKYFKGGLQELAGRLPFYKDIGVTMIYLMPHWLGGYSPIDPFQLDPAFGSATDLKAFVKTAHSLGLKVIFDMVIHGFNEKSPLPRQHPELFVRDESGQLARHPTWGSITTDWASPAYQQYMVDLVLHDQHEYGNDGYRVDAATYKGAGWNPTVPYPAYRDGSAAPELMKKMLAALRRHNPEAVLLSEVFGPVFYSVCNFGHDNQAEAVAVLEEKMQHGRYTAEDYKQHLLGVYDVLPVGVNRVFYARNHDTSWFYHFNGYSARFMAFEAVHALFGIPEVFAGDPDYAFNPDADPRIYAHYKQLFAIRKQPEWTRGVIQLAPISSDNKQVFSGMRSFRGRSVVGLISFSDKPEKMTVKIKSAEKGHRMVLRDIQTSQEVTLIPVHPNSSEYLVTLRPYQTLVGVMN